MLRTQWNCADDPSSKFAREFELPVGVLPLGPQLDKREFSGGDAIPPLATPAADARSG